MRKQLCIFLSLIMVLLICTGLVSSETPKEEAKNQARMLEMKARIASIGTTSKRPIHVTLTDKTDYDGYISEIASDHFILTDAKTGATAPITYSEVQAIKGHGFSTGTKIGIGFAIGAAAAVVIAVATKKSSNNNQNASRCQAVTFPCPTNCVCVQ